MCATARRDDRVAVSWAWTGRNLILDEALIALETRPVVPIASAIIHRVIFKLELSFSKSGGVHDNYTFQCGLVGSFTSPGILDTR